MDVNVAQWVKMLAAGPENLSAIPRTNVVEGENQHC